MSAQMFNGVQYSGPNSNHTESEKTSRTAAAAERLKAAQSRLSQTAHAIGDRIAPQAQALQAQAGQVLQGAGAIVKAKPIPVALTSIGLVWLLWPSKSQKKQIGYTEGLANELGISGDSSPEITPVELNTQYTDVYGSSMAMGGVSPQTPAVDEDNGPSLATRAKTQITEKAKLTKDKAVDLYEKQPLALGALALVAGGIIGATVLASRRRQHTTH